MNIRKIIVIYIHLFLLMILFPSEQMNAAVTKERVIIVLEDQSDITYLENENVQILHQSTSFPIVLGIASQSQIKRLKEFSGIESIQEDSRIQWVADDDDWGIEEDSSFVTMNEQIQDWGIEKTQAQNAWKEGYTGKGVKVAVVDTGIASHQDLKISGGVSFVDGVDSYEDDNGHGTHVAGIIAASDNDIGVVGIAPEASLYAVKVLDKNGSAFISDIIAGIDWAIENDMDIINLSLGTRLSYSVFKTVVDQAEESGVVVVAAAGNDGTESGYGDNVNYPARLDSVIAVGALTTEESRAFFSSTGNTVEIAAPGDNVISTILDDKYAKMSGTSMAAPFVSGQLALLRQAYPEATADELRNMLHSHVKDLGQEGKDQQYGFGLIQSPFQKEPDQPAPFTDTPTHWVAPFIPPLQEAGVISGYPDQTFRPEVEVTRAEFSKFIVTVLQLPTEDDTSLLFTDEKAIPNWARAYVQAAVEAGLMKGYETAGGEALFHANNRISRAEMAVILSRALGETSTIDETISFKDRDTIPTWAKPGVNLSVKRGLINGFTDETFRPLDHVTRAQTAKVMKLLLDLKQEN